MDIVTAALILGIQKQRVKLQRATKKYAKVSANAFKRWDLEKGIMAGTKALAAQKADDILASQQQMLRQRPR
jgi:hypothetical protein